MGAIHVHEFMSLDGVIDAPTWTFDYGFDPKMGEAIGAVTERCGGILLGRTTYEMFEPAWSTRTVEDDPGAPFFNDTTKYVVSGTLTTATWRNSEVSGPYDPDANRKLKDGLDGVIDEPRWTADYSFLPQMEEAIGAVTERCRGILLGRTTY
ncbi:MAG TPA: dihydrofolate reductase family protein [Solirubrobacteraceae bacterium]|nr:dihydrofolate reductase family protein [Solirubrobacteraceae bacterium]